jgi:CDP-diacylglycerol---serine O-phosphatidyltransferase
MKKKLSWVPNALSLGNLTFGFVSILISIESAGNPKASQLFVLAGVCILIAAIFDGFDGIVARALNATSDLGAELDTLADLTTFGIAPGVLMYKMVLSNVRLETAGVESVFSLGMMVAAIFPICAAYRLARFTVAHDPTSFTGLPSPIAGVLVALFPMTFFKMNLPNFLTVTTFVCVALLMVSTIKYSKPQMAMRGRLSKGKVLLMFLGLMIIFALVNIAIVPFVLYGIIAFYVFSGLASFVIHLIQEL